MNESRANGEGQERQKNIVFHPARPALSSRGIEAPTGVHYSSGAGRAACGNTDESHSENEPGHGWPIFSPRSPRVRTAGATGRPSGATRQDRRPRAPASTRIHHRGSGGRLESGRKANYEMTLWRPALRQVFAHCATLTRRQAHEPLNDLRILRNRIAHHAPIFAAESDRVSCAYS